MSVSSHIPAGDFDYDAHGLGYGVVRRPDPRIALMVVAVEPSAAMRAQRAANAAPCIVGIAQALPFDDRSFDACMAVATVHQWSDMARGLAEMRRVAR